MYATKRRKRNSTSLKRLQNGEQSAPSNPSKRHRERLNMELGRLADLLPFDMQTINKLDKLSILRLAVSYLRSKNYFQHAILEASHKYLPPSCFLNFNCSSDQQQTQDLVLQALHGFLMVVTADGQIFYVSETVDEYLGFHQSDIIHQNVFDLIHSEDRNEFRRHLRQPRTNSDGSRASFTVRFRCLLSNASGFVVFEVSGKLKNISLSSRNPSPSTQALFVLCTPFGSATTCSSHSTSAIFRTRHKMDMKMTTPDPKLVALLKYTTDEMTSTSIYKLLHPLDVHYFSKAHDQLIKTGQCTIISYRFVSKDMNISWFQSDCKVVYKGGKPETVEFFTKLLTDDEGENLRSKRNHQSTLSFSPINNLATTTTTTTTQSTPTIPDPQTTQHEDLSHRNHNWSFATGLNHKNNPSNHVVDTSNNQFVPVSSFQPYQSGRRSHVPADFNEVYSKRPPKVDLNGDVYNKNFHQIYTPDPAGQQFHLEYFHPAVDQIGVGYPSFECHKFYEDFIASDEWQPADHLSYQQFLDTSWLYSYDRPQPINNQYNNNNSNNSVPDSNNTTTANRSSVIHFTLSNKFLPTLDC